MINKKDLTNDYEVFEYIRDFLLDQNEKAVGSDGDCQYLGVKEDYRKTRLSQLQKEQYDRQGIEVFDVDYYHDQDLVDNFNYEINVLITNNENRDFFTRCAVGCLIDLENYDSSLEGNTVTESSVLNAVAYSNPNLNFGSGSLFALLSNMQQIHDSFSVSSWSVAFDIMAEYFEDKTFTGGLLLAKELKQQIAD